MKNTIELKNMIQIALVVEDIEKAVDSWCDLLGVQKPQIRVNEPKLNPDELYRGEPTCYGLKVTEIICEEKGFIIELHEVDNNPSTFREFVDNHGYGVHHIGFSVGERRDAVIGELEENGVKIRNIGVYPGGSWTITDTEDTLGVNLNIKPHL